MPTLNENLLSIYNTKLEIKDAIGTNSDVFSEYPDLIRGLRNGIVPTGTYSYSLPLDMYGPYEVDVASYAYISISQGESSAYINSNGNFKPSDFGYVAITKDIVVNVPGPSGNMVIETPGNYNVSSYASVTADFEIPGDVVTVTENGNYYVKSWVYAYVSVPQSSVSGSYTITANGEYDVTSYANAYVNVPLGSAYFYVVRNPEEENEEILPFVDHTAEAGYPCFSYNFGNFEYTLGEGAQLVIFPVSSEEEGVDKTGIKAKIESTFFNTEGQDPVYIYAAGPTTIETSNDSAETQVTIGQIETADFDNAPAVYITRSISNLKLYIEKLHSSSTWSGRWEWV